MFTSPGDVFFKIGDFAVYNYGVTMALACITGVSAAYLFFKKFNPDKNYAAVWDISAYLIVAGILGARLYYCLLNPSYYFQHPFEILYFRQGGLSIHGGLIAGILTLIISSKKNKLPVLNVLDSFACGAALGQAIGRWGNFFNSEAYGFPTDLPWKLYIPVTHREPILMNFEYYHPTFLYESLLDLCLFVILYFVMKKFALKRPGITLCVYLILYSIVRIFVEHFRLDSALDVMGVPIAQIVSAVIIFAALLVMVFLNTSTSNCNHSESSNPHA